MTSHSDCWICRREFFRPRKPPNYVRARVCGACFFERYQGRMIKGQVYLTRRRLTDT